MGVCGDCRRPNKAPIRGVDWIEDCPIIKYWGTEKNCRSNHYKRVGDE